MPSALSFKEKLEIKPVQSGACVSILMSFEPKMVSRNLLENKLKNAVEQAKIKLLKNYPKYSVRLIFKKIKDIVSSLNYSTHKKSIALVISNLVQKIYYLDIEVQEKIIVDKTWKIRDIVYYKRQHQKYLLMTVSKEKFKIYHGTENQLTLLLSDNIQNYNFVNNNIFRSGSSSSGDNEQKFIRQVDEVLSIILTTYPLPLLVASTPDIQEYLRTSKNSGYIIEFFPGNYVDATTRELQILLNPYFLNWRRVQETNLLLRLNLASQKISLSTGIKDVFKSAFQKRGKLLLVEENYTHPALVGDAKNMSTLGETHLTNAVNVKDAVDEIIEQVLDNGGDVEFVREGVLSDHNQIALIHKGCTNSFTLLDSIIHNQKFKG